MPEHPSLDIREQRWTIESGEHVGGFVHTLTQGGPQPIVVNGPATIFYWVTPGSQRRATYTLVLSDGQTATANTTFTVAGPLYTTVEVPPVEVAVGGGGSASGAELANTSYLSFVGTGISFRAQYSLPEGFLRAASRLRRATPDATTLPASPMRTATWWNCRPQGGSCSSASSACWRGGASSSPETRRID